MQKKTGNPKTTETVEAPDSHPSPETENKTVSSAPVEPSVPKNDTPIIAPSVATPEQNAKLEHSQGGVTTRDDKNDLGVPMLPGSPNEPVGPEDALGLGPTRGDYTGRIGEANYHPHEGNEPQRPRAEEIGDVPGKKGGVETE